MKSSICEVKISLERLSVVDQIEGRISGLEDKIDVLE
jgi:hypothetical protein